LNIIGHYYYQTPAALATEFYRQKRRGALRLLMARTRPKPVAETLPPPFFPGWARIDAPITDTDEAAFRAGAALAMLDGRVRDVRGVPFAGAWRRRLALKAAAASARIARRGEDEAMLRDAFFLRHGGDDPGPAGRLLVAWRGLDRSTPLSDDAVFHVAETLQLNVDEALRAAIAEVQQLAASAQPAPFAAAQAARVVVAQRPDAESLALWLADAVLAARLKWSRPLPLIAGALAHPSLRTGGHRPYPSDPNWTLTCCVAYGRAAVTACDLFAELGRRSQQLLAVAPRLRARGAGAVIEILLNEDAVLASARRGAMSDRGMRRLFDRLVALGGVRELTGRSTFRLYGL
jgi:Protein of unknown function (DUF1403)